MNHDGLRFIIVLTGDRFLMTTKESFQDLSEQSEARRRKANDLMRVFTREKDEISGRKR